MTFAPSARNSLALASPRLPAPPVTTQTLLLSAGIRSSLAAGASLPIMRGFRKRFPRGTPLQPAVGIIMGSQSDWDTMRHAAETLEALGIAHETRMVASMTPLPVLGVPIESAALKGLDSLLSIVQMPGGVPVGTLAIGKAGAIN